MARRVLMAEVSGGRVRGRLRLCWMDGVKVAFGNRWTTVEAAERVETGEPLQNVTEWVSRGRFSLYPNPPPLHAIPYTTSPSSTPTQSLHPLQTSAHAPQTHYPTFPRIVIPLQSHTPYLNTQDGYQQTTQTGTTANDHIFLWEVMHNVQHQLNNMMSVMSPTPASCGKPTYTQ